MASPILGGLLAGLGGCAVAALNDWINRRTLKNDPDRLPSMSIVRELLSLAYFVAVYLLRVILPWETLPLLIGAALGLTIPSILFSLRLAKLNDALAEQKKREQEEGGGLDG